MPDCWMPDARLLMDVRSLLDINLDDAIAPRFSAGLAYSTKFGFSLIRDLAKAEK